MLIMVNGIVVYLITFENVHFNNIYGGNDVCSRLSTTDVDRSQFQMVYTEKHN